MAFHYNNQKEINPLSMKTAIINERKLRIIIKDAVRDVLEEELMRLRLLIVPHISKAEQKEIERTYKEPSRTVSRRLTVRI
jgi:hypothetical protein